MNILFTLAFVALLSVSAVAAEPQTSKSEKSAVKTEKRTKKTAICPTCGKPESKCECEEDGKKHEGEHEDSSKNEAKKK